jgi:hypothetical protein
MYQYLGLHGDGVRAEHQRHQLNEQGQKER